MTFLPIIGRELRVRARARGTYGSRLLVGIVSLLVALPPFTMSGPLVTPAALGQSVSNGLFIAGLILSCCACFLTISSVHLEQREGTLGLLLLTRVGLFDVLLGKLGAISLTTFSALLAFSPVLMLPILAGGVTGGEACRQGLSLLNSAFLSLTVGLFASAGEKSLARAAARATALVVVIVLITAVFWTLSSNLRLVGLLSPLVSLRCAADSQYKSSSPWPFWTSMALVQGLGWGFLGIALLRLRAAVQEPAKPPRRTRVDLSAIPATPPRRWHSLARSGGPIEWLFRRQPGILAAVWAAAVVDLVMRSWLFGAFLAPRTYLLYMVPSVVSSALSGGLIAWAASRFFIEARRTGELETLLTTPAGARSIISGQWRALQRLLIWPLIVMMFPLLVQTGLMMSRQFGASLAPGLAAIVYNPISISLQVLNMALGIAALAWLGLFFGYRSRNQPMAVCWSVAVGRGIPYLLSWVVYAAMYPIFRMVSGSFIPWSAAYFVLPMLQIIFFLGVILLAKRRLVRDVNRAEPKNLWESVQDTFSALSRAVSKARDWPPPVP